jgi:hypothetical protein
MKQSTTDLFSTSLLTRTVSFQYCCQSFVDQPGEHLFPGPVICMLADSDQKLVFSIKSPEAA